MSYHHDGRRPSVDRVRIVYRKNLVHDPRLEATEDIRTFSDFQVKKLSKQKKLAIKDLPSGTISVSFGTLNLRERRITSLDGLRSFQHVHTIFLQDNALQNLEYLAEQPTLTCLNLERNLIDSFLGTKRQPKINEVWLDGNPISNEDLCSVMCCLSLNPSLKKVNGKVISKQERELIHLLDRPALRIALEQGWILTTDAHHHECEVNLPVEEFFFRLEPAIENVSESENQLPTDFDIHFHLKRSYEMLADLRVSRSPRIPRRETSQSSDVKPKAEASHVSMTTHKKPGPRNPWRITNVNTHNKLSLTAHTPTAQPLHARRERKSFPLYEKPSKHEDSSEKAPRQRYLLEAPRVKTLHDQLDISPRRTNEILDWKLSSLDFETPRNLTEGQAASESNEVRSRPQSGGEKLKTRDESRVLEESGQDDSIVEMLRDIRKASTAFESAQNILLNDDSYKDELHVVQSHTNAVSPKQKQDASKSLFVQSHKTVFGQIAMTNLHVTFTDWKFIARARKISRLSAWKDQNADLRCPKWLNSILHDALPMYQDVMTARILDNIFRTWLLNVTSVLCNRKLSDHLKVKSLRSHMFRWKLSCTIKSQRANTTSHHQLCNFSALSRAVERLRDDLAGDSPSACSVAQEKVVQTYRVARRRMCCAPKSSLWSSLASLQDSIKLSATFRSWRECTKDSKIIMLTQRVSDIEDRIQNFAEREQAAREANSLWDRKTLKMLVRVKFINSSSRIDNATMEQFVDLLMLVTGCSDREARAEEAKQENNV